ncbi:MAG: MarR family transcriptional regulator [Flavobacteriaceae bacterium]|nr:MAG: MarR family transcriptional regulator [Flavobacteriaceae bacterium]
MGNLSEELNANFTSEKLKAIINIKFTSHWLEAIANDWMKPYNLTIQQFNVLRILRGAKKPITVQEVKKRMVERAPNATRLMDKLCKKTLIERLRCDTDRRVVYVKITSEGLELLSQIDDKQHVDTLKNISDEDAKLLNVILDKIR